MRAGWVLAFVSLLFVAAARAEGQPAVTVCSSGCSQKTINAAILAAACGSRIILSSAETFYGGDNNRNANNPVRLRYKNCAPGNPITITTDRESRLPAPGTRITPNYADGAKRIVPLILNPAPGMILTADVGNLACGGGSAAPCPAHDYQLIGLEFCCSSEFSDFIGLGVRGIGSDDPAVNTLADLPSNITFDRILVRADPLKNMRRCITFDGVNVTIENSWIDCGYDINSSDSQAVAGFSAKGVKIWNNYIAGSTEPVSLSGGCSPIRVPVKSACSTAEAGAIPTNVEVAFNEITKPAWVRLQAWRPGQRVPKGQVVHPASSATGVFRARKAGSTADKEPAWPQGVGRTVTDGGVEWERTDAVPQAKNLLEAKAVDSLNIHHNYFHGAWPQGQQGYALTFTTSTSGAGAFGLIRNVRVENNVIAEAGSGINTSSNDSHNDINAIASIMPSKAAPYSITDSTNRLALNINGTRKEILLPTGKLTAKRAVDAINAQIQPALACAIDDRFVIRARRDGSSCTALATSGSGNDTSISVDTASGGDASGALGFRPGTKAGSCFNPRTNVWYGCGSFDGLTVRNNLWAKINMEPNRAGVPYVFGLFNRLNHVTFAHNTVDADPAGGMRMFLLESPAMPHSNVSIRDNIFGFRTDNPHPITQGGTLYDFSAINYMLCNRTTTNVVAPEDSICPEGVVTHNIMPGAPLWKSKTRDTRPFQSNSGINSYPSDNWDDPWSSLRFADAANLDYTLVNGKKFRATEPAGAAVGAEMTELPFIRRLKVTTESQKAVFSFAITKPMLGIPCVIRVSPSATLDTVIADLDPSQFNRPDSSSSGPDTSSSRPDSSDKAGEAAGGPERTNLDRSMVVGSRAPLTAGTVYYYHLSCGGAARYGMFQTAAR